MFIKKNLYNQTNNDNETLEKSRYNIIREKKHNCQNCCLSQVHNSISPICPQKQLSYGNIIVRQGCFWHDLTSSGFIVGVANRAYGREKGIARMDVRRAPTPKVQKCFSSGSDAESVGGARDRAPPNRLKVFEHILTPISG